MEEKINKKVIVEDLSKRFKLNFKEKKGLLAKLISISKKAQKKYNLVLNKISFSAVSGESVGIIGDNGSGKSTLLRIIAGIYSKDKGYVKTFGNLVYLGGSNFGLKIRLTMRENIYLVCSILGLSRKEINDNFKKIVDFSGLEDYLDTKLFKFSSGMLSRLNFSIMINSIYYKTPNILLIDEAFDSGGDINFKTNALAKIEELMHKGATILLVSHNMGLIKRCCNRVLFIDKGKIIMEGKPNQVIARYIKSQINH